MKISATFLRAKRIPWRKPSCWLILFLALIVVLGMWWLGHSIWRSHRNETIESVWARYVRATGYRHSAYDRIDRDLTSGLSLVKGNGPLYYQDEYGNVGWVEQALGYADSSGRVIIEPRFLWAGQFSEGLAWANEGNGVGFIDTDGEWVIRPSATFQYANGFHDGRARVRRFRDDGYGEYGYIDRTGNNVIPIQYDAATDFFDGYAMVGNETLLSSIWTFFTGHLEGMGSRHANLYLIDVDGNYVDPDELIARIEDQDELSSRHRPSRMCREYLRSCDVQDMKQHGKTVVSEKTGGKRDWSNFGTSGALFEARCGGGGRGPFRGQGAGPGCARMAGSGVFLRCRIGEKGPLYARG